MKHLTWPVVALALGSLTGCSNAGMETLPATERQPIVNGMLSSPDDNAVVAVFGRGSGCTGTLISPTAVLTAMHCVTDFDSRFTFSCRSDGTLAPGSTTGQLGPIADPQTVSVGFGVSLGAQRVYAKAIYGTGSTDVCHDDLAVIVLESALAVGDVPLVSLRFAGSTRKGEFTRAVGYGDVEKTQTERGRQERTHILVRGVGGPDASNPGDTGVAPRTLQVGEGPCHGDSGGPLFSEETGAEIGVYSLLHTSTCTGLDVRNTYTLVAPFEPLIRMALESEGAEPIVEPGEPGEPDGSAGEAGATSVSDGGRSSSGGAATSPTAGSGAAPTEGSGRGSFRDSSCAYRVAGGQGQDPWLLASSALMLAVWTAARRRARAQAK